MATSGGCKLVSGSSTNRESNTVTGTAWSEFMLLFRNLHAHGCMAGVSFLRILHGNLCGNSGGRYILLSDQAAEYQLRGTGRGGGEFARNGKKLSTPTRNFF